MNFRHYIASMLVMTFGGCDSEPPVKEYEVTALDPRCVETVRKGETDILRVTASFHACLSTGCDTLLEATCGLSETEEGILLEGKAVFEHDETGACYADCREVMATCDIEPSRPGAYEIVGDSVSIAYDFPSTESKCHDNL